MCVRKYCRDPLHHQDDPKTAHVCELAKTVVNQGGVLMAEICAESNTLDIHRARVARDLIKSHPLTPELSAELFAQKGIGAFWLSETLIEWL